MSDVESINSNFSQQPNLLIVTSNLNDKDNEDKIHESEMLTNDISLTPNLEVLKQDFMIKNPSENPMSTEKIVDDDKLFYMKLDLLDTELRLKPPHWGDEYWNSILERFPWFVYKDEHAGCKICMNIKSFIGKKSLLSYMKLYLMTLSYDEFEHKLTNHNLTLQHMKCMDVMKEKFNISVKKDGVTHLKTPTSLLNDSRYPDWSCPQCGKIYKFKKSLVTHICSCDPKIAFLHGRIPCNCKNQKSTSLVSCDLHMVRYHPNQFLFSCRICGLKFHEVVVLFEHLFLKHDYLWNPYKEFPQITLINNVQYSNIDNNNDESQNSFTGVSLDDSNVAGNNYENHIYNFPNRTSSVSGSQSDKSIVKRKHEEDFQRLDKKPMQETTNYNSPNARTIDLKSIVVCPICEGRYLSSSILQTHIDRYHTN